MFTEYLASTTPHYFGIVFGAITVLVMGLWYPLVIKGEYYFGKWPCTIGFALIALISLYISTTMQNLFYSVLWAFWGFDAIWAIEEVFEQEARVAKGMYPRNPKRGGK